MQIILKHMKKLLFLGILGAIFFFFDIGEAQACRLTSGSWGSSSITVGKPVTINLQGQSCNGYAVAIWIYEEDPLRNDPIRNFNVVFTNDSSLSTIFTPTAADYTAGGNESGSETIFFKAFANDTEITSSKITFTKDSGKTLSFTLDIPNPLESDDFGEFVTKMTDALFALAIPAAVFIIILAGVRFVLSQGNLTKIAEARKMLWYAIIGLAIILIGSGFISLIESILNLGDSSPPTEQTP
ncbi:MAG: hypothetical protein Q8P35_03395 [Candidatus Yanofskybacteria bacterium]|nr:hypothetical protein [Candidatus Yanofskybacteria bacterium]